MIYRVYSFMGAKAMTRSKENQMELSIPKSLLSTGGATCRSLIIFLFNITAIILVFPLRVGAESVVGTSLVRSPTIGLLWRQVTTTTETGRATQRSAERN